MVSAADRGADGEPVTPRIELVPGYSISRIIKGGWQLAGGHGVVDPQVALDDMARFVDAGITTFDCADIYTGVESLIGRFLRQPGRSVPVQIHTKLVPDLSRLATYSATEATAAIDRSLSRLGVERLDLVQFHWWDYGVRRYLDVLEMLVRLRDRGKIRCLGLTNFDTATVAEILDAGIPVVSHQVQYSVLDGRPASAMVDLCRRHAVGLLCYGTLAGGFLSERWRGEPEPAFPHDNRSRTKYHLIIEEFGGWALFQRLLDVLSEIAAARGVGLSAVAIAWVLAQPGVSAAIVGATSAAQVVATVGAASLVLGAGEIEAIDEVRRRASGPRGDVYALERERDGRHARIMKYDLNERASAPRDDR